MKKYISSAISLTAICAVVSLLLALTNYITAPIIEKNQNDEQINAESNNLKETKEETTIENNLNEEQINKETITK